MRALQKVIIIGGGPAGLVTALRLHQTTKIKCSIYELRTEPTTLGGAVGILPNGMRLFDRLGLLPRLLARGSTRSGLTAHSSSGSSGVLGSMSDVVGWARDQTGYGYMRIKRTDLMDVLVEAVEEAKILLHFNKRITHIDEDKRSGVTATFSDGSTDTADLLLGCDGIHSTVRGLCVDPSQTSEYTGLSGLFSTVPASALSTDTVAQLTGFDVTMTQEGMFAVMLCTANGDEVYWGFSQETNLPAAAHKKDLTTGAEQSKEFSHGRDGWEVRRKEEVDGFKRNASQILEHTSGSWATAMHDLIDHTEVVKFYPVYRLPLGHTWARSRCLLLGDAAHAMPPHAGQGVSMALEDAFLIARLLQDHVEADERHKHSLDKVLNRFEDLRRPRISEIYAVATRNGDVRKKTGPWGLWFKEWMIMLALWIPANWRPDSLGFGQKHLVYDVDKQALW